MGKIVETTEGLVFKTSLGEDAFHNGDIDMKYVEEFIPISSNSSNGLFNALESLECYSIEEIGYRLISKKSISFIKGNFSNSKEGFPNCDIYFKQVLNALKENHLYIFSLKLDGYDKDSFIKHYVKKQKDIVFSIKGLKVLVSFNKKGYYKIYYNNKKLYTCLSHPIMNLLDSLELKRDSKNLLTYKPLIK